CAETPAALRQASVDTWNVRFRPKADILCLLLTDAGFQNVAPLRMKRKTMYTKEESAKQSSTSDVTATTRSPGESMRSFLGLRKWSTQNAHQFTTAGNTAAARI